MARLSAPAPRGSQPFTRALGALAIPAAALLLAGCGEAAPTGGGIGGGDAVTASQSAAPVAAAPSSTPTATATAAPTPKPTPAPTPRPTPVPTKAAANLCGAPANPWNYTFCSGSTITSPPSSFCGYFACIDNFWKGTGYVMECQDGRYSKSGGHSGSCSYHGGNWRALLQG